MKCHTAYMHLINPRHTCAARVTVVGSVSVSVSVSVTTSRLLVLLTNDIAYSAGNLNHLNQTIFFEKAPLPRSER